MVRTEPFDYHGLVSILSQGSKDPQATTCSQHVKLNKKKMFPGCDHFSSPPLPSPLSQPHAQSQSLPKYIPASSSVLFRPFSTQHSEQSC